MNCVPQIGINHTRGQAQCQRIVGQYKDDSMAFCVCVCFLLCFGIFNFLRFDNFYFHSLLFLILFERVKDKIGRVGR